MASSTEIANVALRRVDRQRIASLTEGSTVANLVHDLYDPLRRTLLRGHDWNFARRRTKLARETAAPASGFAHAYKLPADWIRTVAVASDDRGIPGVRYRQERDAILCSADAVFLTYIADIADANLMPADFRDALSWSLASQIGKTATDRMALEAKYEKALRRAKSADAIEDQAAAIPDGEWVAARHGAWGG